MLASEMLTGEALAGGMLAGDELTTSEARGDMDQLTACKVEATDVDSTVACKISKALYMTGKLKVALKDTGCCVDTALRTQCGPLQL